MTVPARLTSVGFGLEATYGTAVAPVTGFAWTKLAPVDDNNPVQDKSWHGSAANTYGHETGTLDAAVPIGGPVLADSIGYLLAGALGDYQFTAGTPNTHVFALLNTGDQQPPAYTITSREPIGALQWAGCKVTSLKLDVDADNPIAFDASLVGLCSATSAFTPPAVSGERLLPGWGVAATIGGSAEPRLLSASVLFTRTVDVKRNVDGSQAPWLQRLGGLSVTGDAELAVSADIYRAGFLAGGTTSIDLTYTSGVGAALRQLKLHCSQVLITALSRDYGGKWIGIKFSWEAEANASDAGPSGGSSPVKVTLKNQIGSGVYK